ncbi:ABC transporter permease subunit [Neobacillus sp. PS3-34]|uniref:ABC transporter permease subunit n=1 Tax=Neobacillus sp. PS3-34 TaxID=3070678 RepID=UPI0027E003C0|nr:ABC transporter permease subunit [Neobacillus sp. PS3-34]WML50155.1 ABC transporter permease subunit [Neobacillus sp. PS3-34]
MVIVQPILRQALLWAISTFLFLSILFIPRNVEFKAGQGNTFNNATYHYSIQDHITEFKNFYLYIKKNRGFGEVSVGYSLTEKIGRTFFKSMKIAIPAIILGFFAGIAKGVFDYRTRNRRGKLLGVSTTKFFLSVPDLFLIIMIQIAIMTTYEYGLLPLIKVFGSEHLSTVILCIVFLSIYPIFHIATITYYSLHDEQGMDYIRTALAKGITSSKILYFHMLKNCLVKILSQANTITLYVLSNLFIVEFLTSYRGAAYFFFRSVAPPGSFTGGIDFHLNTFAAAGYTIMFTLVIFIANTISQVTRKILFPYERS